MNEEVRSLWKGSSAGSKASIDEALKNAVTQAAKAYAVNNFPWRLRDIRSMHGGVVGLTIDVQIEAYSTKTLHEDVKGPGARPVYEIKRLETRWVDRTVLHIESVGTVTSSGWTNPVLSPRIYVRPPPDGIWEFDFVATEPTGPTTDPLVDLSAKIEWPVPYGSSPPPRGIRVCAATNAMERHFTEAEITNMTG